MEEQAYTYRDLAALTQLSDATIKRRLKRLERSRDIVLGRKEITPYGHQMMFRADEVETLLEAMITVDGEDPGLLERFRQMGQASSTAIAVAPIQAMEASGPVQVQTGRVSIPGLPMDELAVSEILSDLSERQLPIRAATAGILIALFEDRSRPYSPDTVRKWCKGRGAYFERIGFRFTWADGAIMVSRPLI